MKKTAPLLFLIILCGAVLCLSNFYQINSWQTVVYHWNSENQFYQKDKLEGNNKFVGSENIREIEDLDTDGVEEMYSLQNDYIIVKEKDIEIWRSPKGWRVDSFFLADSDNDGVVNINLSVWKQGSFGSSQPFWIKENDQSIKNHFFVFKLEDDQIKPVWQSSNLDRPNCEFTFADLDHDGQDELVVLEGEYEDFPFLCVGKNLAVWEWERWGFVNQWRSEVGVYKGLRVVGDNIVVEEKVVF